MKLELCELDPLNQGAQCGDNSKPPQSRFLPFESLDQYSCYQLEEIQLIGESCFEGKDWPDSVQRCQISVQRQSLSCPNINLPFKNAAGYICVSPIHFSRWKLQCHRNAGHFIKYDFNKWLNKWQQNIQSFKHLNNVI